MAKRKSTGARAMWKGTLQIGNTELPVKLYGAVQDQTVRFRLLHARDKTPVEQRMADPESGKEVDPETIQRGLEVEKGVFVILTPEELEQFQPEPSRTIAVTRFVPRDKLDLSWYSRPYFLGPDGSDENYFALAQALEASGRRGIVRWTMRGKRYFGALEERAGYLALIALHSVEETVPIDKIQTPETTPVTGPERKLAEELIATLDAKFDPDQLHDEYRERVRALIEAKAKGRRYAVKEAPAPKPTSDLTDALKRSLKTAKQARVA
jgi:DNA end-binding protein Ku